MVDQMHTGTDADKPMFEVVTYYNLDEKVEGTITVNDKEKLVFNPPSLESYFEGRFFLTVSGSKSLEDGLDFVRAAMHHMDSGYVGIREVHK